MIKIILLFLFGITLAIADDNNDAYELMSEFGCKPPDNWKLIKDDSSDGFVKDVCLPRSYQINEPPEMDKATPVSVVFKNQKIGEINERKKYIALHIDIKSFWEDPRINARLVHAEKPLPSTTKSSQSIWTPLTHIGIKDVKELIFILDPVISRTALITGTRANKILSQEIFLPNATVAKAVFNVIIKFFCDFDFSNYPFDHQTCSFEMASEYISVTAYDEDFVSKGQNQNEFGGYDVKQDVYHRTVNTSLGTYSLFGIKFSLKRQLHPYIYQYFLPSNVIVFTSFFSFIIPLTAVPGRVAIIVTQMLTLMSIFIHEMV